MISEGDWYQAKFYQSILLSILCSPRGVEMETIKGHLSEPLKTVYQDVKIYI